MRYVIAVMFALVAFTLPVRAGTTFATDVSDLWYNPNESGWGVNIIHQSDTLFITLFVYDEVREPVWFVGPGIAFTSNQAGTLTYSGPIYRTSGPWFGVPFTPPLIGVAEVGTATFNFDSISTATLTYTVHGVSVTKRIERQTWRTNDATGSYIGASIGTYSGCVSNGYDEEPGRVTVAQTGTTLSMTFVGSATCVYSGPYSQNGRMGAANGTFSCSNGFAGTFSAFEIEAGISGFTARATAQGGTCQWSGRIGGLRTGS